MKKCKYLDICPLGNRCADIKYIKPSKECIEYVADIANNTLMEKKRLECKVKELECRVIELDERLSDKETENTIMLKRLQHLLESEFIRLFDEKLFPVSNGSLYKRDIKEADEITAYYIKTQNPKNTIKTAQDALYSLAKSMKKMCEEKNNDSN